MDLYTKQDNHIDTEEFCKSFRLCFFTKIQLKRFSDIINFKLISLKNKITKTELMDLCTENDDIMEIFFKNFTNEEEIEALFQDEIHIMCDTNLKKSKYLIKLIFKFFILKDGF